MSEESFEEQQETLDPHRREERDGIALELVGRLRQKGVIITAIDRFEAAVVARGGDLLVNTPYSNPPENPDFVIPARMPGEDAEAYAARINSAADRLETADL